MFGHDPRVYQTTVKEFVKDKEGNLCKLILVKLEAKKDEKTGRMNMVEIPGSEYEVDCQLVLIAAGFLGSEDYVTKAFKWWIQLLEPTLPQCPENMQQV